MLTRVVVCGAMGFARLAELAWSRRNIRGGGAAREGEWSRRTFPLIFLLHASVLLLTLVRGERPRWPWLAALLAVQPLRYWVLATLGRRWNARGSVASDLQVATDGPYSYVRHPNYSVIAVELASLPAGFGLGWLAVLASLANASLLALRIRDEEAMLFDLPGYREHFEDRARFLPGLF